MVHYGQFSRWSIVGDKVCLTTNSPNTVHIFCSGAGQDILGQQILWYISIYLKYYCRLFSLHPANKNVGIVTRVHVICCIGENFIGRQKCDVVIPFKVSIQMEHTRQHFLLEDLHVIVPSHPCWLFWWSWCSLLQIIWFTPKRSVYISPPTNYLSILANKQTNNQTNHKRCSWFLLLFHSFTCAYSSALYNHYCLILFIASWSCSFIFMTWFTPGTLEKTCLCGGPWRPPPIVWLWK